MNLEGRGGFESRKEKGRGRGQKELAESWQRTERKEKRKRERTERAEQPRYQETLNRPAEQV